jgi:hypothetical protein
MEFDEASAELDQSAMFRQAASELIHVHDLESTLSKFGYSSGDRIERRDLVLMYKKGVWHVKNSCDVMMSALQWSVKWKLRYLD